MFTLRVVEHTDVVENILPRVFSGFVGSASDAFAFQEVEEAFGSCVVVTVSASAHEVFQIVLLQDEAQSMLVNWEPWSEWIRTFPAGFLRQTAMSKACRTRSVV